MSEYDKERMGFIQNLKLQIIFNRRGGEILVKERDLPCICLNKLQNKRIQEVKEHIYHRYGIMLDTSDIVSKAVQFYLDCHMDVC